MMSAAFMLSPGVAESETAGPLRAISQIIVCGSHDLTPHSFSKLDVWGAHLSGEDLKSWGASCAVHTLHFSGRCSKFGVLTWVWVAMLGMRFM